MHPPSIYSFITSKRMLPVAAVIVIILFILFYGLETNNTQKDIVTGLSPTPIAPSWKAYTDNRSTYILQAPQQWQSSTQNGNLKSFIYTESGKEYSFNVFPDSSVAPEVSLLPEGNTVKKQMIEISGKKFEETTLLSNNTPYKIYVIPKDGNFSFYSFVINLPPTNTQKYIDMFNKIIQSISIQGNYTTE